MAVELAIKGRIEDVINVYTMQAGLKKEVKKKFCSKLYKLVQGFLVACKL